MFNDYMWQTYLNAGGKAVAKTFESYLAKEFSEDYASFVVELRKA